MIMDKYAKAIVGGLIAGAGAYGTAVIDGVVTQTEWAGIAVVTLTALGIIWGVPNGTQVAEISTINYTPRAGYTLAGSSDASRHTISAAEGEARVKAAFPEDHYTTGGDE
jgi:hypothetical protein